MRALVDAEPVPARHRRGDRARPTAELAGDTHDAPVAVRSSATAEDTEAASFAGMNETFLNVRGADAVVDAVHRCWSSLFGARTIFYRAKRGFGQADMDIAVVVQRQIDSQRAGVMFTIDPSSGATDRLVIEGSFGLGEAVVSGRVSPDRYVVEKGSLTILVREVHAKEAVIESAPGGGTTVRELTPVESLQPTLNDAEVQAVAALGRTIERHYGTPQDTEWAIDADGTIWMLQSRPVTTTVPARRPRRPRRPPAPCSCAASAPRRARRAGPSACSARSPTPTAFVDGEILVTRMTVARLGAADAPRGRDRDRLRRDDLPRGDRVARARHPLRRRHADRDQGAARRRRSSRSTPRAAPCSKAPASRRVEGRPSRPRS